MLPKKPAMQSFRKPSVSQRNCYAYSVQSLSSKGIGFRSFAKRPLFPINFTAQFSRF